MCLVAIAQMHSNDPGQRSYFRKTDFHLEECAKLGSADLAFPGGNVAVQNRRLSLHPVNTNGVRRLSKSPRMFNETEQSEKERQYHRPRL